MIRRVLVGAAAALVAVACSSSSKPAQSKPAQPRPLTVADINAVFHATSEANYPNVHFTAGLSSSTSDGHGGTFTAVLGLRDPSGDGKGMIVGFWHEDAFIGLAQNFEVLAVSGIRRAGPGRFTVSYLNYRDTDPLCCPTGTPAELHIVYHWTGKAFVTDKPLPKNLYRSGAEVVVPPR